MPRIFDNINETLLGALKDTLGVSQRGDFCVGYFNLRGWRELDEKVESWSGGEGHCCRLLVGMHRSPDEELRRALSVSGVGDEISAPLAQRLKTQMAKEFRGQLSFGIPTTQDETGLRRLAAQIKAGKVTVKLFLRHPLHAKLYLLFRPDPINPIIGYLGSSNLTLSGLRQQGELNIDVLDHDACKKLSGWFEERWSDPWCFDISEELVKIIETSWARTEQIPPYHIYMKIAYHLSREARAGLKEFSIPKEFSDKLFDFQKAAVKIAAHHLNKRAGVLIGDVVGLGKTLMAAAVARIMEEDHGVETLILCPKNLVPMWDDYRIQYRLHATIVPFSQAINELPTLRRHRLVLIDESHNLRNREGARYKAIQDYIQGNESKCILLSATPYNKSYLDLSNQLRLFIKEDKDLGVRPERLLKDVGEIEFTRRHQCPIRSLAAFEKSPYADDWRDLMRLYMVRRTRSFIRENYAEVDPADSRKFLRFQDGTKSFFPVRRPKTVKFKITNESEDPYARLFSDRVVDTINSLTLPRYGLGNYIQNSPHNPSTVNDSKIIQNLSRAGQRLKGFCRTNLFKRLESSGFAFLHSMKRHVLRNYVYLHALDNNLDVPIGPQDVGVLDSRIFDEDVEWAEDLFDASPETANGDDLTSDASYKQQAASVYDEYKKKYEKRFKWLHANLFSPALAEDLRADAGDLLGILRAAGNWEGERDQKLTVLLDLVAKKHAKEKILVFTQFADTARYLEAELKKKGVKAISAVTGNSDDPTALAWRFSPDSNQKRALISPAQELRILIATDILSEGQNLQDASIVVNFDLPWAIVRLIQRVGRVDRIGQKAADISCYSFLPAEGVDRIIKLRSRIRQRLSENAEVVGTDEAFFEDDKNEKAIFDLYNENAGVLDGDDDADVDLASFAYQIWKNAIDRDPSLEKAVAGLPEVVYSTKGHKPEKESPSGALVYLRTAEDNDALAWVDEKGGSVSESQLAILKAAECSPDTPPLRRADNHHDLVAKAVEMVMSEEKSLGGQLGRPSGARYKAYERIKRYAESIRGTLFDNPEISKVLEDLHRFPLRSGATDVLNRQLRTGVSDQDLAGLAVALRQEGRLCSVEEETPTHEPRIICSLGLSARKG